ncbi:MAG: aspartate--tRNA(Asn) ligase [Candidatus Diapherotrites archaeon]
MKRLYANELNKKLAGKKATIAGWVFEIRDFGKLKFVKIRDKTGYVQVTAHKANVSEELFSELNNLTKESVVIITGELKAEKQAPNGVELIPSKVELLARAETPVPLDISGKIKSELPSRLDWRCIDLRTPENQAIIKIESKLLEGMRDELLKQDFTQVFTPCLMGAPSESGSEVFSVNYHNDKKVFLRQDPQLHRQLSIASGIEKVFDIGPCWRAEKSHTTQHLSEHRVVAAEMAFLNDETDTIRLQEDLIISAMTKVNKDCKAELELLGVKVNVPTKPFPEFRFPEIYNILEKEGCKIKRGEDLDAEANNIFWEYVQKKHKSEFYFFNRFPSAIKPFYVMRVDDEPDYARSVDLNFRGTELSSGGQREHRYDKIISQLHASGMSEKSLEWFTKFFKYGVPPHGGFAIGIERITKTLLNIENIREVVLFPRDTERILP